MPNNYLQEIQKTTISAIVELYTLTYAGINEYYTDNSESVDFAGNTYIPAPISRGKFSEEYTFKKQELKITSHLTPLFLSYITNAPVQPATIRIFRVFRDNPDNNIELFFGQIKRIVVKKSIVTVDCIANIDFFNKKIPKWIYQSACNNTLFDSYCKLNKTSWEDLESVTVEGVKLSSPFIALKPDNYFSLGKVVTSDDKDSRPIDKVDGNSIYLQYPFQVDTPSPSVFKFYPGCDKTYTRCQFFSNLSNFRGCPGIPGDRRNPAIVGFQ